MRLTPALLALPLCACTATTPPPASAAPLPCNGEAVRAFIGQQASAELGARMLAASGARDLRWVGFGRMVTMEFREGRLTVHLDRENRVSGAACT